MIPFFAWSLWVFGGVPVDRNHRDKAIQSIRNAALSASSGGCVVIAPEGTRSKSGQLLEFKKGPFYLWDEMKSPIVPLVFEGAFDLLPPGYNIAKPGRVYARFLPPILPSEANNREEMSLLVRKKMLEAIASGPPDAATKLDLPYFIAHIFSLVSFYCLVYFGVSVIPWNSWFEQLGVTSNEFIVYFLIFSIAITLVLYILLMYVFPNLESKRDSKHKEKTG